jgi:hypothetical protein
VNHCQRRRVNEPVEPGTYEKTYVIAGADVVKSGIGGCTNELRLGARNRSWTLKRRKRTQPNLARAVAVHHFSTNGPNPRFDPSRIDDTIGLTESAVPSTHMISLITSFDCTQALTSVSVVSGCRSAREQRARALL